MTSEQSNNQFQNRHKEKIGLGYVEHNDSSKSENKKGTNPTCTYCGKIRHTTKRCWSNEKEKINGKCFNCGKQGNRAFECIEAPK